MAVSEYGQDEKADRTVAFVWTVALVFFIFLLDVLTPIGILIPILYVIPLLITLRLLDDRHFVVTGCLAALLTIFGAFLSAGAAPMWIVYGNRLLALLTIPAMWFVHVFHRQTARRLQALQNLLPQCASCKKVRDDVGYWSQLELYLEEHLIKQFTHSLCPACERQYKQELLDLKLSREKEGAPS